MRIIRIALAQVNLSVGDLKANLHCLEKALSAAQATGADLVVFPELAVTGYPPEDLLLKPEFVNANLRALESLSAQTKNTVVICGFAERGDDLYNAAAVLYQGRLAGTYRKVFLPNYSVFDEDRYFRAGTDRTVFQIAGARVGISICEDIWYPEGPPTVQALDGGAELLINLSSSPYFVARAETRARMLSTRAADTGAFVAYCNLVGGQDELVFDGQSMIFSPAGDLIARGPAFEQALIIADLDLSESFRLRLHDPRRRKRKPASVLPQVEISGSPNASRPPLEKAPPCCQPLSTEAEIYRALVTGTHDYVLKNGFQKVLIGLSGGIDSSLVAVIAVDALGAKNVIGVAMPSRYSSLGSRTDAKALAETLGIELRTLPIESVFTTYEHALVEQTPGCPAVVWENLQARIRGNYLMALSNAYGWLVLATGNKSELSTGYCTLYGDMSGGFAVIKDVLKTYVYRLAKYINHTAGRKIIPSSVLTKPPSAELKADQRDTDTLPPYEALDPILQAYVEEDRPVADIIALGHDADTVMRVVAMVDRSEYKRRQGPLGIRISPRAFGRDRRLPITNRFRPQPER